jgi:hypothetical protein
MLERPPKIYFCLVMKNIKKDVKGVKNISILKLMKMQVISWAIYMIMDYKFLIINYLLNN